MMGKTKKEIIMDFMTAALGLINKNIIAISFNKNKKQFQFNFYLLEQDEETKESISDILFEFEALQNDFIKLEKCEVVLNKNHRYTLKKNEILIFAINEAKNFLTWGLEYQNYVDSPHNNDNR